MAAKGTSSHDKNAESIALAIMLPKRKPMAPLQVVLMVRRRLQTKGAGN